MSRTEPQPLEREMISESTKMEIVHRSGIIRVRSSLEEWYEEYDESEPLDLGDERNPPWLKVIKDDTLDSEAIEEEIERLRHTVQLSRDGFCLKCQEGMCHTHGKLGCSCSALVPLDSSYLKQEARNSDGISYILNTRMTGIVFDIADEVTRPAYLLPLGDHMQEQINGIVIEEVDGQKAVFCRIGYFFYRHRTGAKPWLRTEIEDDGLATAAALCAEEVHDPEHPEQKYVITLV